MGKRLLVSLPVTDRLPGTVRIQDIALQPLHDRPLRIHGAGQRHIPCSIAVVMEPVMLQTLHIIVHLRHIHRVPEHLISTCYILEQLVFIFHQIPPPFHRPVPVCDGLPVLLILLPSECAAAVGVLKHHLHLCRVVGMGTEIVQMLLIIDLQYVPHHPVVLHALHLHPECLHLLVPASSVKEPGIVRAGLPDMHAPLRKAPGAALPAHPEEMPGCVPVARSLQKHLPVILEIRLEKAGIVFHDLLQGFQHVHVLETGIGPEVVSLSLQAFPKLRQHLFPCPLHGRPVILVPLQKTGTHVFCPDTQPATAVRQDKIHPSVFHTFPKRNSLKHAPQIIVPCPLQLPDLLDLLTGQVQLPQMILIRIQFCKGINLTALHLHPPLLVSFF